MLCKSRIALQEILKCKKPGKSCKKCKKPCRIRRTVTGLDKTRLAGTDLMEQMVNG